MTATVAMIVSRISSGELGELDLVEAAQVGGPVEVGQDRHESSGLLRSGVGGRRRECKPVPRRSLVSAVAGRAFGRTPGTSSVDGQASSAASSGLTSRSSRARRRPAGPAAATRSCGVGEEPLAARAGARRPARRGRAPLERLAAGLELRDGPLELGEGVVEGERADRSRQRRGVGRSSSSRGSSSSSASARRSIRRRRPAYRRRSRRPRRRPRRPTNDEVLHRPLTYAVRRVVHGRGERRRRRPGCAGACPAGASAGPRTIAPSVAPPHDRVAAVQRRLRSEHGRARPRRPRGSSAPPAMRRGRQSRRASPTARDPSAARGRCPRRRRERPASPGRAAGRPARATRPAGPPG